MSNKTIYSYFCSMKNALSRSKISIFFVFIIASLLFSCKKDTKAGQIPNVYVNFYIYLNDPSFAVLNSVGSAVLVTGGVKGIIIYRSTFDTFTALERCSSYKPSDFCAVNIDSTGVNAIDPCSLSKFSLIDGSVVKGPANLPLKTYQTFFDGDNTIHIFN